MTPRLWMKVDVDLLGNTKMKNAGLDAMALFIAVLSINFTERGHGTLTMPQSTVASLCGKVGFAWSRKRTQKALAAAIQWEMLERTEDGGLRIVGWGPEWESNFRAETPTKDTAKAVPRADKSPEAVRQQRYREMRRDAERNALRDATVTNAVTRNGKSVTESVTRNAESNAQGVTETVTRNVTRPSRASGSGEGEGEKERQARNLYASTTARAEESACVPDGPLGLVGREPEPDAAPQESAPINPLIRPGETPDDAAARIMRDVRAKTAARTREEEAGKRLIQSLVPGPIYGEEAQ